MTDKTAKELIEKLDELSGNTYVHDIGIGYNDLPKLTESIYSLSMSLQKLEYRIEKLVNEMQKL